MARMPKVQIVQPAGPAQVRRTNRNPRHPFAVEMQPFELVPFFIAPVLPGETMKNLNSQMTVKSGLLDHAMSGWWHETYFFYVKHRDLVDRNLLTDFHVKNSSLASLVAATASTRYFRAPGAIDWVAMCLRRVVEEYFRNEGEDWDDAPASSPGGFPMVSIGIDDFLDSAIREGSLSNDTVQGLPDEQLEWMMTEDHTVPAGFEDHYDHWLIMRRSGLIATDFEDYLRHNGIRVPQEDVNPHRPELLRYLRDFSLPRRATAPNGQECSVLEWKQAERADKDRLFREPGFLFGVQCVRPKVYRKQVGSISGFMQNAFNWLPALMMDNPETSLIELSAATATAIFPDYVGDDAIFIDLRDLLLYGEQFINGTNATAEVYRVASPGADFHRRYISPADLTNLWFTPHASLTPVPNAAAMPAKAFIAEGIVSLAIASRIGGDTSTYGAQYNPPVAP